MERQRFRHGKDLRPTRFPVRVPSLVGAGDPPVLGAPCQLAFGQREEVQSWR